MADFFVHFPEVAAPVAETERFLLSQVLWLSDYKTVCTFSCGLPRVCDTNRAVASSGSSGDSLHKTNEFITKNKMDKVKHLTNLHSSDPKVQNSFCFLEKVKII